MAVDFEAEGPVTGTITADTILGARSGTVAGSFKVRGADSAYSITAKLLGLTESADYVVVDGQAYSRSNGGQWTQTTASGRMLQILVASLLLRDAGVETRFDRPLHHLTVDNVAAIDLTAFGIAPGSRENLTVGLSFWAQTDGTPAGMTIEASFDQKILGTNTHETVLIDIEIESLSGVEITPPTP
jgi:hypothetical protein